MNLWWRLVRFGFRLLYNEMAFTYDWVSYAVSLGEWRCWQRAALKHLNVQSGARILELAHGTGNLQIDLHALGYHVLGYDLSPYMGQIAQRKLNAHHLPARLARSHTLYKKRFQTLPSRSAALTLRRRRLQQLHRLPPPSSLWIRTTCCQGPTSGTQR